ncbi:hypothetical protein BCEP4_1680010 [Burkholderia cepacia]|nr:hypothetical protein BCEP4_1680010 [Burkholderia cepacia]
MEIAPDRDGNLVTVRHPPAHRYQLQIISVYFNAIDGEGFALIRHTNHLVS